eukprot:scaffold160399_cov20-Tisochrysis_lutea.AAC.3
MAADQGLANESKLCTQLCCCREVSKKGEKVPHLDIRLINLDQPAPLCFTVHQCYGSQNLDEFHEKLSNAMR